MIEYKFKEELEGKDYEKIGKGFEEYAQKNNVVCNYKPFAFVAESDGKQIGIITGNSYYKEVHIGDLIVDEEYRGNKVGKALMEQVENHFKDKGFENINLTTYDFQAPEFYKKCGYKVEYIRECKNDPKLNKYYLVKYL